MAPASELDELFRVTHSLRISSKFHRKQMAGEIDFVVMSQFGIRVIEVNGGIIGYEEGGVGSTGYFRSMGDGEQENMEDPFIQVDGNADTVKKYLL